MNPPHARIEGRRQRRMRLTAARRKMVQETHLDPAHLIQPIFVTSAKSGVRDGLPGLPGMVAVSLDRLAEEAAEWTELGLGAVLLFGVVPDAEKTPSGAPALDPDGPVPQALRLLRTIAPDLILISDLCLCEYTNHGHCGIIGELNRGKSAAPHSLNPGLIGQLDNDQSVERLVEMACLHAQAGADIVAPSDMLDFRIQAIRQGLDRIGATDVALMSYAAKFASHLYGPFRDQAGSTLLCGDRRSHQLPIANRREALAEVDQDVTEGADLLLVKPASCYLDLVRDIRDRHPHPLAVYQVSGEYAMIKSGAAAGWLDEQAVFQEHFLSFRRAGADLIISYHAKEWLRHYRSQT